MRRIAILALVVSAAITWPSPIVASAALTISVPPATLSGLAPGTTSSSTPVAIVVGAGVLENWFLHVDVTSGARMTRTSALGSCALTKASLTAPLHASFSGLVPLMTIDVPELDLNALSSPVVAHGTAGGSVNVAYSQTVADNEALVVGCAYSMSVTFTASAS